MCWENLGYISRFGRPLKRLVIMGAEPACDEWYQSQPGGARDFGGAGGRALSPTSGMCWKDLGYISRFGEPLK